MIPWVIGLAFSSVWADNDLQIWELASDSNCSKARAVIKITGSESAVESQAIECLAGKTKNSWRLTLTESSEVTINEALELQEQVESLIPFIVTNERGIQKFLTTKTRIQGVSARALELGHKLVALNNRIIMAVIRNDSLALTNNDFRFIEPLLLYYAQYGSPCGDFRNPDPCPPRRGKGTFFEISIQGLVITF